MQESNLIPNLFRTEYSKLVAVLCSKYGVRHLQTAEDTVSDVFMLAANTWGLKGTPENPTAWLYTVAKNRMKGHFKHQQVFDSKVSAVIKQETEHSTEIELDMSEANITDSQLKMMYVLCHETLPQESQIALVLRILCGFGIEEIANALLSNKATINKRLFRAKEKLKQENLSLDLPEPKYIVARTQNVSLIIYLLFNEGYYSQSNQQTIRKDFCLEAMRLGLILTQNKLTNVPLVNALMALMCFHASRMKARVNQDGDLLLFEVQDKSKWDQQLIVQGEYFLNLSATGEHITKYHLEASIAYWHTSSVPEETKWNKILELYNFLLQINYSPVAALNRTYALAKVHGVQKAIGEAQKLNLSGKTPYHALLANLYVELDKNKAEEQYLQAIECSKSESEIKVLVRQLQRLKSQ